MAVKKRTLATRIRNRVYVKSPMTRACDIAFGWWNSRAVRTLRSERLTGSSPAPNSRWSFVGCADLGGDQHTEYYVHRPWWGTAHVHGYDFPAARIGAEVTGQT